MFTSCQCESSYKESTGIAEFHEVPRLCWIHWWLCPKVWTILGYFFIISFILGKTIRWKDPRVWIILSSNTSSVWGTVLNRLPTDFGCTFTLCHTPILLGDTALILMQLPSMPRWQQLWKQDMGIRRFNWCAAWHRCLQQASKNWTQTLGTNPQGTVACCPYHKNHNLKILKVYLYVPIPGCTMAWFPEMTCLCNSFRSSLWLWHALQFEDCGCVPPWI